MKTLCRLCFLILIALLTGCAPISRAEQADLSQTMALEAGQSAGQTFTAAYGGLSGVELYLTPGEQPLEGEMVLELRASPMSQEVITQAVLPLSQVNAPGYYRFLFPVIPQSGLSDYYFTLEMPPGGRVDLGCAPGDAYLDGALYADGQPLDAQLAFRLVYEPMTLLAGLFREGLSWLGIVLAASFVFVLPGWAVLSWILPEWRARGFLEKAALSAGVSVAFYPVLFLWAKLVNLRLCAVFAWGPPVIALLYLVWKNRKLRLHFPRVEWFSDRFLANLAAVVLLGMIVFIRMWGVRELPVPMWGDSYQHTVMAQLIVDNRGLFDTWLPYADLHSLTYHFGFQSLVAVFHWITGIAVPRAAVLTGQVFNVLAVVVLVPLVVKKQRTPWAAAVALLAAGLASPMPMYYTNWGRYTQVAGQLILPAAICLVWEMIGHPPRSRKNWGMLAAVWAGLALTHYRVFLIGGLFILVLGIFLNKRLFPLRRYAGFAVTGSVGIILLLPWLLRSYTSGIVTDLVTRLSTPAVSISQSTQEYNTIGALSGYAPAWLWFLALLSVGVLLWKRDQKALVFMAWGGAALLASNPSWLKLPGDGIISNFALFIFAYFWLALLISGAADHVVEALQGLKLPQVVVRMLLLAAILAAGMACLPARRADVQMKLHQLFTRADERAALWIRQNTPEDSVILVNSMFAYGGNLIVGTDGGWWLPLMAGRTTTLPPLTYGVEAGPMPNYIDWVNHLPAEIQEKGLLDPQVVTLLKERGITYLYIGQRQGSVNYGGPKMLDPQVIRQSPDFQLVYHQDRVWIFSFHPQPE